MQRGYKVSGDSTGLHVEDPHGNTLFTAEWHNGMPRCKLAQIFNLHVLCSVEVNLSDGTENTDDLSVWHLRTAHTSESVLLEAHRRMAVIGMRLHR